MWRRKQREVAPPMTRIFNSILQYAVQHEVRDIRIEICQGAPIPDPPGFNEAVVVSYLFGDDWKEQMKMPAYVQPDLLAHICTLAAMDETQNSGEIKIGLRDESDDFHVTPRTLVEITEDETVLLRLRFLHPDLDFSQ